MACRFPGVPDLESFWELLIEGREVNEKDRGLSRALSVEQSAETTGDRLDLERFDASFFQISPRECEQMDPQQRILLEVGWHAAEDAGLVLPKSPSGGVFVSSFVGEQITLETGALEGHSIYTVLGSCGGGLSGRLSSHLGLHGPSVTLDSACSSSLMAVHLAMSALAEGDCEFAIAGGVHVMRFADVHACYESAGLLSPSGQCRFGSDSANGISRGEGAALVVLKPLERALADRDRIYAVVLGSAANHNGRRTSHISRPSSSAQADLLSRAYVRAGVDPAQVRYVECHGTGTLAGDPLEIEALRIALAGSDRESPLLLGSVKSNLGHTEPVAGVAGIVKSALALHRGILPPTLHVGRRSRRIDWERAGVDLVVAPTPLDVGAVVGVSSFGITGSNSHVVLQRVEPAAEPRERHAGPLLLSAGDEEGLKRLADVYRERLVSLDDADFPSFASCSRSDRSPLAARLAIAAASRSEAVSRLDDYLAGRAQPDVSVGRAKRPSVVFAFTGQGGQWWGMAAGLTQSDPAFRATFERAAAACRAAGGPDLLHLLGSGAPELLEELRFVQPAITAYQLALFDALCRAGLEPDLIVGHSMGEIAAAACCGALTAEEAMRIAVLRSEAVSALDGRGALLLVEASPAEIEAMCAESGLEVGAHNGPRSFVLSGSAEAVARWADGWAARGVFCRRVRASYASHSAEMDPLLAPLRQAIGEVQTQPASRLFRSSVLGLTEAVALFSADYWAENLRRPVGFWPVLSGIAEAGQALVVEIGPHPILGAALEHTNIVADCPDSRDSDEAKLFSRFLARTFCRGCDLSAPRPPGRQELPRYPFKPERHPVPEPNGADTKLPRQIRTPSGTRRAHPLLPRRIDAPSGLTLFESTLGTRSFPFLADHRLLDQAVLPASLTLEIVIAAFHELTGRAYGVVRELSFGEWVALPDGAPIFLQTAMADQGDGSYQITIRYRRDNDAWRVSCVGVVAAADGPPEDAAPFEPLQAPLDAAHYERFREAGIDYGPHFRTLTRLEARAEQSAAGTVAAPAALRMSLVGYKFHPALLDGAFQAFLGASTERDLYVPVALRDARFGAEALSAGQVSVTLRDDHTGALVLRSERSVLLTVAELVFQRIAARRRPLLHVWRWEPASADVALQVSGRACVIDHRARCASADPVADALALAEIGSLLRARLSSSDGPAEIVVVTRGAADLGSRRRSPLAAAVWAMLRCLRGEHPDVRFIALDAGDSAGDAELDALVRVARASGEEECAVRDGRWWVPRLSAAPRSEVEAPSFSADRTYLVAGGTGALGLEVVRWMVERGARRIIALGRSRDGGRRLEGLGSRAELRYLSCDLSDRGAVRASISAAVGEHGPVHGLVLATGALRDGLLVNLSDADLLEPFAAKAAAARHLLEALDEQPLDFVVGFSSAAAAIGSPGQSGYAAANAYLEALVSASQAPLRLSIQWGPWAIGGLAAGFVRQQTGVRALETEEALAALGCAWGADLGLALGMSLDEGLFRALPGLSMRRALRDVAPPVTAVQAVDLAAWLDPLPAPERARALERLVAAEVASIVGIPSSKCDPSRSLMELGMDSLMALELRRRLEARTTLRLSTGALLAAPSVGGVSLALAAVYQSRRPTQAAQWTEGAL